MRKVSGFIVLSLSLLTALKAFAGDDSEKKIVQDLTGLSVPAGTRERFLNVPEKSNIIGESHCYAGRSRHVAELFLVSPADQKDRFIGVIERTPSSGCKLDPPGFDYGQIPQLKDLNESQADALFGKGVNLNDSTRYRLTAKNDEAFFLLDLVFKDKKVQKFRVFQSAQHDGDRINVGHLPDFELIRN
jgi:hypothetical protein